MQRRPDKSRSQGKPRFGASSRGSGKPPRSGANKGRRPPQRLPSGLPPRRPKPAEPPPTEAAAESPSPTTSRSAKPEGERLQKFLAAAGLGSRRQCEELIVTGRVEVDRRVVVELGTRVDQWHQEVRVDGEVLRPGRRLYYAVNKPQGVVSTNRDPSGRPRVVDLIRGVETHLYPVGRLDLNSDGLILVTNDGEMANRLTHPRYGIQKTYRVLVAGEPTREDVAKLLSGIRLAEGVARADSVKVRGKHGRASIMEIVLSEGKNREIRRMLAKAGHKVLRLTRLAVGPIRLGRLAPGEYRKLTHEEIDDLHEAMRRGRR